MRIFLKTRRARFEALEGRELLAGGGFYPPPLPPAPVPHMVVTSLAVPEADVLPGMSFVLSRDKFSAATRNKGMLAEINLLPADGSDQLARNIDWVEAWANLKGGTKKDGPRKDGYETFIGSGSPNRDTDVISLPIYRRLWVSKAGVSVEYVATASQWLDGDAIGVSTEYAAFRDLRGNWVDDGYTTYKDGEPTLHTLESQRLSISQQSTDKYGSALAGQEDVNFTSFYDWWSGSLSQTVTFTANQGDFANIQSFSLVATSWQSGQVRLQSGITPVDGKLVFEIPAEAPNGAIYEVWGDVANTLADDPHLQLAFDTSLLSAVNAETGKPLKGIRVNGSGNGQIQIYTANAPVFSFVKNPELVAKELEPEELYGSVDPGTLDVVLESFTATSGQMIYFTSVSITAAQGDLNSFTNYTMYWDTNRDGIMDGSVKGMADSGSDRVVFGGFMLANPAGNTYGFEIRADARDDISYGYLRVQLAGDAGISAKYSDGSALSTDKIFKEYNDQTAWYIGGGGMG